MSTTKIAFAARSGAFVLATIFGLAACSASFDRGDAVQQFIDGGMSAEMAGCVVDGMVEEFGEDKLTSDHDLGQEEQTILQGIVEACIAG